MDKNQATGLILFAAVILVYSMFFATGPEIPPAEETLPQTEAKVFEDSQETFSESLPASLIDAQRSAKYGSFAALTLGTEEEVILENDKVLITLSTKGAVIKEVILKEYKSWNMEPLALLDEKSSKMGFSIESSRGAVDLSDLYFSPKLTEVDNEGVKTQV
jgi:YidC/Oxa1 family membrane protein insertase